jgi:DNA-binding NarL/FixJ family response regulator
MGREEAQEFATRGKIEYSPSANQSVGEDDLDQQEHMNKALLIIDGRALERQCLAHYISELKMDMEVVDVSSVADWRNRGDKSGQPTAVLLHLGSKQVSDPDVAEEIKRAVSEFDAPLIVLADSEELTQVLKALECGARGYIPSSVNIHVCVEAISLSVAGGIFVPASSVFSMRRLVETPSSSGARTLSSMFTARQAEVVEALRRGKANKIIAFELNLRESTVKVHIRNIMKKLKATNRTEVAYKIKDLFPSELAFDNRMISM